MKKVGILGGTFNPVHMAHLIIAEIAREEAGLDDILFIPSGCSYLKDASDILPAKDRIHMTGLAIEDNSHFALSTIEIDRGGNSYTCDTLLELKHRYPELKEKYHADITLLHVSHVDISSSLIREKIAQGLSIRYMLPEKVREYIIKNHFYEKKDVQE